MKLQRCWPVTGSRPTISRPSAVITVLVVITGAAVRGLRAVHSCRRLTGTLRAELMVGAGVAAGRITVARTSLFHQISDVAAAMTTAKAVGAQKLPLGRGS